MPKIHHTCMLNYIFPACQIQVFLLLWVFGILIFWLFFVFFIPANRAFSRNTLIGCKRPHWWCDLYTYTWSCECILWVEREQRACKLELSEVSVCHNVWLSLNELVWKLKETPQITVHLQRYMLSDQPHCVLGLVTTCSCWWHKNNSILVCLIFYPIIFKSPNKVTKVTMSIFEN